MRWTTPLPSFAPRLTEEGSTSSCRTPSSCTIIVYSALLRAFSGVRALEDWYAVALFGARRRTVEMPQLLAEWAVGYSGFDPPLGSASIMRSGCANKRRGRNPHLDELSAQHSPKEVLAKLRAGC